MNPPRSPIELLGAILDEVEGLRRTDARSFLPTALIAEARLALEDAGVGMTASPNSKRLAYVEDLQGRTVEHIFDGDLKYGDLLILCSDGAFLSLEANHDGDDDAFIAVTWNRSSDLKEYLRPADLLTAGLITMEQKREAERAEEVEKARQRLERATQDARMAQAALERLQGKATGETK